MSEEKTSAIRPHNATPSATWSSAGRAYDEVSRGIADAIEHCIERLAPKPEDRILDVATGTGWTARRMAERDLNITAMDFAPDVLEAAKQFAAERNFKITFEQGDAEDMRYADNAFDSVISTFGVMFVQRPEDASRELARVCKPGGRLALAVWTPDGNIFEMFKVMKAFMPQPAGTPPPSPFAWGDPERVRELLQNDFELTFEKGTSYYREPNGEAAWNTFSVGYGPLRTLITKLDDGTVAQLKQNFIEFHNDFATGLGICVPRDYWVVVGHRK